MRRRRRNSVTKFMVTFKGGRARPVWEITPRMYQAAQGVHAPWIAEISPMQMSMMSARAKAQWQKKRSAEWQASADVKDEWAKLTRQAFAAQLFDIHDPGVSQEARSAVLQGRIAAKKAAAAASEAQVRSWAHDMAGIKPGDVVWRAMYASYGTVARVNRLSVRFTDGGTQKKGALAWASHNDIKAAAAQGVSSRAELIKMAQRRKNSRRGARA